MKGGYFSRGLSTLTVSKKNLSAVFAIRRFRLTGILVAVAYGIVYMYLIGNIVYAPDVNIASYASVPSIVFANDWTNKVWSLRAPGNWEPIAAIYPYEHFMILLPIPNLIIGAALSLLFGANISLALYQITTAKACGRKTLSGIFGAIPSFLTGFGCCVPTAALALGASFVAAFIALGNILLPASILILVLALLWNASRATPQVFENMVQSKELISRSSMK